MKNSKKILSLSLAATMLAGSTTAFAMPADTVVLGDKAFDIMALAQTDNTELQAEIDAAVLATDADSMFYKLGEDGKFLKLADDTEMTVAQQTALKNVVRTKADGVTKEVFANFEDETGTVVAQADLTAYNTALAAKVQADYTVASWTAYQVVVAANVVTMANTQVEVDAATAKIVAAQGDLVSINGLMVESVSAINLTQMEVKFSQEVDKTSAETIGNYQLGTATLTIDNFDGTNTATEATARLKSDKKTVVITLAAAKAQQLNEEIKISNIQNKSNTEIVSTTIKSVKFSDISVPEIATVTVSGNKLLTLNFSEPVTRAEILSSQFKIDGNSLSYYGGNTIVTDPTTGTYVISANIATNNAIPAGAHTLTFDGTANALRDAASFPIAKVSKAFSISGVATAPTAQIVSATSGTTGTIKVKFSENVNVSTLTGNFSVDGSATVTSAVVDSVDKSLVIITATNLTQGANVLVIAPAVKDAYGNSVSKDLTPNTTSVRVSFTAAADATKPEVVQVLASNVNGVASESQIRVKFSESIDLLSAQNTSNYIVKDSTGSVVASATSTSNPISGVVRSTLDGENKIVTINLTNKLPGGDYSIEVKGVKDGASNVMITSTKSFNVVDKTAPTLKDQDTTTGGMQAVVRNATDNTITVYFNEPMAVTGEFSMLNKANYRISTLELASNATISAGANNKSAVIQYSTSTLPTIGATKVQVIVVKDANGVIGANLTSDIIDGATVTTGPKVEKSSVKAYAGDSTKDYITFTTDKQLTALEANDIIVTNNGVTKTVTGYSINAKEVTVNLADNDLTNGTAITLDVDQVANNTTDATGAKLDTFDGNAITAKDMIAPKIASQTRSSNNIVITFDENLDSSIAGLFKTDWIIDNAGTTVSVSASTSSTTALTLVPQSGVTLANTNVKAYPATTVTQTKDVSGNVYVPTAADKLGLAVPNVPTGVTGIVGVSQQGADVVKSKVTGTGDFAAADMSAVTGTYTITVGTDVYTLTQAQIQTLGAAPTIDTVITALGNAEKTGAIKLSTVATVSKVLNVINIESNDASIITISDTSAATAFGGMVKIADAATNTGTAAIPEKYTIQVTHAADAAGTVKFTVGTKSWNVDVTASESVNDIATALKAKIDTDALTGYTAAVATDTVTLTKAIGGVVAPDLTGTVADA